MRFERLASYVAAILLAALAPAGAEAILDHTIRLMPIAFFVGLGHVLLLGMPLYLILRLRNRANAITAAAGGFVVAAIPSLLMSLAGLGGNLSAKTNGVQTVVNGVPTLAGWIEIGETVLMIGIFGALAGETFWIVLRLSGAFGPANADDTAPGKMTRRPLAIARSAALTALAMLLSGSVLAIPSITKDRSCHNLLRDRSSIGPKVVMRLQIEPMDWPNLAELFRKFGGAHSLSFRDYTHEQPGTVQVLGLSLCNEDGIAITAHEQRWASQKIQALGVNGGVFVSVYETREHSRWPAPAREIIDQMDAAWPGKLSFQDGGGHTISVPDQLRNASAPNP